MSERPRKVATFRVHWERVYADGRLERFGHEDFTHADEPDGFRSYAWDQDSSGHLVRVEWLDEDGETLREVSFP